MYYVFRAENPGNDGFSSLLRISAMLNIPFDSVYYKLWLKMTNVEAVTAKREDPENYKLTLNSEKFQNFLTNFKHKSSKSKNHSKIHTFILILPKKT